MELSDKVKTIIIDTGNIMTLKEMQRKTTQTPTDELVESITYTLKEWLISSSSKNMEVIDTVECVNKININQEDRQNLKLTVKIFLSSIKTTDLKDAIEKTIFHLNISSIDSVIVSLENDQLTLLQIKPLWEVLQNMVNEGKILTIGFSDLDTKQLKDLYHWSQVKPSVNQVNLDSCCVMPPEMTAFAKENNIQLFTHNDPKNLLPGEMIPKLFKDITTVNLASLEMKWIVRYSVVVKSRGIIQSKGFILSLCRLICRKGSDINSKSEILYI